MKGIGSLSKSGAGKLTIANSSNIDFGGNVTIASGTLEVGNGGTTGDLGVGSGVINSGTLVLNRGDSHVWSRVITGAGTVRKEGPGIVTLANAAGFSGPFIVNGGVVRIGHSAALGNINNNVTLNPGAQVEFGGVGQPDPGQRYSYTIGGCARMVAAPWPTAGTADHEQRVEQRDAKR